MDEYQDTNDTQYQWLLKLSQLYCNICCVGDDDQSIYSWRGANVANILRFEKDFADAKIIRLEQNYRSTSRILRTAHSVISNNKERHGKSLWSELGEGEKIQLYSFYDDRLEASKVANHIKNNLLSNMVKPSQIAVLVRAGYQTRQFEEAFMQNGIAYKVVGGMKFYERMEIRDSIAYLRLCSNFSDDLAFLRVVNVPKRGIGDAGLQNLQNLAKQHNISLFEAVKKSISENSLKGKSKDALANLVATLEKFHQLTATKNLSELAEELLEEVGYMAMWRAENSLEAQGRIENIEEFIKSLSDFGNIIEFLEYATLVEARDDKNLNDAVNVMTIHSAKGLEFEMVFLPGLEEGIFPSNKSVEQKNGLEEERRLMYVAITRAKKKLIISFAKSRYIFGEVQNSLPSRFLKELPENEINFEEVGYGFNKTYQKFDDGYDENGDDFADDFSEVDQGKNRYHQPNSANFYGSKKYYNSANSNYGSSSNLEVNPNKKFINNLSKFSKGFAKVASSNFSQDNIKISSGSNIVGNQVLIGARVFHQKFGYGKITEIDGNRLTINFEKTGIKTVMKDFVSFE